MILETRHLRLAMAVADLGSLTRAAPVLHLTQSALSHQLIELEGRLRTPLFHRVGRRMVPTAAGQRLLKVAKETLPALVAAEEELQRLGSGRDALLRLSTECYTCYHWLPSVLESFRKRFPRVDVQIVAEATRYPIQAMFEGKLDLAIVHSPVHDGRLDVQPLFQDELVVVMAPDHRLASRPYVRATDFADEHVLIYPTSQKESTLFRDVLTPAGVSPARVSSVQVTEGIIELVKAGNGIAVLARWAVAPHVEAGTLRAISLTRGGFHRHWSAVSIKQSSPPEYLRGFTRLLTRVPAWLRSSPPQVSPVSIPREVPQRTTA